MKQIRRFLLLMAGACALSACAKELLDPQGDVQEKETITINVSLPDPVKTSLGDKVSDVYPVLWSEGDVLYLNGVASEPLGATYAGTRAANFSFTGEFTAPYKLTYCGKAGSSDVVTFKAIQSYTEGTFENGSAPMYGYSDTHPTDVALQPANAVIRFALKSDCADQITKIILQTVAGESISGEFKLGVSEGVFDGSLTALPGGSSTITYNFADEGETLGTDASYYYLPIPSGDYEEGFRVYVLNTAGEAMELKFWGVGKSVESGIVYELSEASFAANTELTIIATAEDLMDFASTKVGLSYSETKAYVINDIDLNGYTYSPWKSTPHGSDDRTASFNYYGFIDGCGHTISGLTTPLFNEVYGQVQNLNLEGDIEYDGLQGQTYGIGMLCHYVKVSTEAGALTPYIDNVTTNGSVKYAYSGEGLKHAMIVGGVIGGVNGVEVKNCVNNANVSVDEGVIIAPRTSTDGKIEYCLSLGGVAGALQTNKDAKLINCANNGDVTCSVESLKARLFMGGIVGRHTMTSGEISKCTNYGSVTVTNAATLDSLSYIGGVIGAGYCTMSELVNEGNVEYYGTASKTIYVGGVDGCDKVATATSGEYYSTDLDGLVNKGNITVGGTAAAARVGGVTSMVGPYTKKTTNCTNEGDITISVEVSGTIDAGGVTGELDSHVFTNNHSSGRITLADGMKAQYFFVGGLAGITNSNSTKFLECSTEEGSEVKVDGAAFTTSTGFGVGGFVGKCGNFNKFVNSTNNADVIIASAKNTGTAGRYDVGAVVGYIQIASSNGNANGQMVFDQFVNNGDVRLIASPTIASYVRVGGFVGNALSERQVSGSYSYDEYLTISGCTNNGNIILDDITGSKNINVGGFIGHDQFTNTLDSCSVNNGNITVNGSNIKGNELHRLNLGGHIGLVYRNRYTNARIVGLGDTPVNTGKISFNPNTTLPFNPIAGGIVGAAIGYNTDATGDHIKELNFDVVDCTNAGDVESTLTGWTYNATDFKNYDYFASAGGIVGNLTGPWTAASKVSYSANHALISNCTNKGMIAWGKKSPDFTDKWNGNYSYTYTTTGGIVGLANAARATHPFIIDRCCNEGDILSYDGVAGGIAGYIHSYVKILGSEEKYCKNSGNILKGGHSKPQAYAGGIIGWIYTHSFQEIKYTWNAGYVYANAGVGGFAGYLSDNVKPTIEYFKNSGTIQSSTSTGAAGLFAGTFSSYAWLDGHWLPGIDYVALGGKLNARNSSATTFVPQGSDATADNYFLKLFGAYKNNEVAGFRYDPDTKKASTAVQATQYAIILEHFNGGKTWEYWDGVSKTSWE